MFRSKAITDSTRVLLLAMADHMRADGRVSVPRGDLAVMIDRDSKRITERIQLAISAGLLDRVSAGSPGRTAEYVALLPQGADGRTTRKGADSRDHYGADGRTPTRPDKGAPGGAANSRGFRSESALRSRDDHDLAAEIARAVSLRTGTDIRVGTALRWLREIPGVADATNPVGFVITVVLKNRAKYLGSTPTPPPIEQVFAEMGRRP